VPVQRGAGTNDLNLASLVLSTRAPVSTRCSSSRTLKDQFVQPRPQDLQSAQERKVLNSVQECHEGYAGVFWIEAGQTRRSSVTTIKYTARCSIAGQDLARAGKCAFSELEDQGHDMASARRGRGHGASRGGRAVCADSEAPKWEARYGDGGGLDLSRSLDIARWRSHWLHHMWRLLCGYIRRDNLPGMPHQKIFQAGR